MKKRLLSTFMALLMFCSMVMYLPISASAAQYNVTEAVNYAKKYWSNYNPNYPNCNDIGGDCANFVSQCLYAGGIPQDSTWKVGTSAWQYCPSMVAYFRDTKHYKVIDYAQASDIKIGNPVFYWNNNYGKWSHVAICTGFSGSTPLVTAHNNNHVDYEWTLGGPNYWGGSSRRLTVIMDGTVPDPILPGIVDTKYSTNVSCTAPSQIHTYNEYGNRESDRWVDAGDSCIAIEAYTNGYWKIDYPASGSRRIAYMKLSEWNPFASIILPGMVDSKYSKNVSCTAQSQIHTYDEYGNCESNRWVDAGDSCIAIEAYTNGYWKIDYPASGSRRIAYMKLSEWNPFENTILPGTVDTKYKTNISCTAPSQINTYDANGNRESNRWVDAGDSCIAIEAYTNGYWKIDYPAGSTRRIAYMKLSEWNPFTNAWIVDTRYNTNVSCTAPSQIHTYDSNGNQESNRWVDPGDSCIAIEAYTNGFWKIDYPAGSVRRIAYMKLSEWNPFVVHTHSYTSRVTKEATCTVSGVRTYSCSCGDTYTETIPAPGHDYTVKTVAPTTTAMGYDLHTCKVCNYSFKDNYTDIVHTHSYTSEVTKEPSCTATGITTYSCSCGDSFTEIISATGHTYTVKTIAPTETSQGYDLHTCTVCNHSYKDNFTDIVVHTHSYTEKITKAATCTEDGIKTYTCSCGKSYNEVIKATGHKYIVKTVPPTETEAGYDQHTCSVCGKFYIDNVVAPGTVVNAKNPVVSYEKGDGCVKLTWTAISGADKYAVYGYMNNKWKSIAQGSGTSYTLKGLTAGKNYKVVVIARFNGTWNTKDISKAIVVTPKEKAVPEYPVVTSRSVSGNAFQIKWTAVKNAESYGIARYSSGKWVLVDDKIPAGTTTYTKKNVPAGTYTMVVCAKVNGKWDTSNLESRAFKIAV